MREKGSKTLYPGVYHLGEDLFRVCASWKNDRGERRSIEQRVTAQSPSEALAMLVQMREDERGSNSPHPLVGSCALEWIDEREDMLDVRTAKTHRSSVAQIVRGVGHLYVDELDRKAVQTWVKKAREEHYRSETIKGWLRRLSTMCKDFGWPDVTSRVVVPASEPRGSNTLRIEDLGTVLAAARADLDTYPLFAAMGLTGLRWAHATPLRWTDIDEHRRIARIERKNVLGKVYPVSKVKKAPEEVALHDVVLEALQEHRRRLIATQCPGVEDGWCFPYRATGKLPLNPSYHADQWKAALTAGGITERVTIHGLRRTFTDALRRADVDAIVRRSMVGHSDAMMQHYSTVDVEEQRAGVDAVVKMMRKEGA